METLFISDLHLQPDRPAMRDLFLRFLDERTPGTDALYILGDLFEYWIGDDGGIPAYEQEVEALARLSGNGVPVTFLPGNRDFLVGSQFAERTGIRILHGINSIDLYGRRALILHGDELCTDDQAHQEFRKVALDPEVQEKMLALPLNQREQMARTLRSVSKTGNKPAEIMDVNDQAVRDCLAEHHSLWMIHGHTHRPAIHEIELDGVTAHRCVLPDWSDEIGGYLSCDSDGYALQAWPA